MLQELLALATATDSKAENVGLGVRSPAITGVSHDALWRAMTASIREPARFMTCSGVSIKECGGFVQRTLTAGSETYLENIYVDEPSCEIAYRKLVNGSETDVERVVTLRTHPLQLEFHQRNKADGFRVEWGMPKAAPLGTVEAFVREARRTDSTVPTTVGYGITSDPIRDCSFDSLCSAVELAIKEPWRVIAVDQASCECRDCEGFVQRRMRLTATGETVVERVTVKEGRGEVTYNKCDANGTPGATERVLAIRQPLRLEFYERNARSGLRLDWKAPFATASDTFTNIVQLARKLQQKSSDVVGMGVASKPLAGVSQDAAWRAMLYAMRSPAECGLKVDSVSVKDEQGRMRRSMRLLSKPGCPTVTDCIRANDTAQEIAYRPVVGGQEGEEERVFALRTEPLRFEMFCRNVRDGMRLDWQAPRAVATQVFDSTAAVAQRGQGAALGEKPGPKVGMGWTSPEITGTTFDGLWAAMIIKARNPAKFMDVSDVVVVDRPGFLARSMTVNATKARVEEHVYANERSGEMIYRLVDPASKRETEDERVMAVKESPLRMEFFHRHVSDGYRCYWQAPVEKVQGMLQELLALATATDGKAGNVGLGVRSPAITGVSHDALWRAMTASIREPARFMACSSVSIKECGGFVQRTLTAGSETYLENIYVNEPSCEIAYRKLVNGSETDLERVVALRTHPLQIEFHQRNKADGFRVQWDMPKEAPLGTVEAFVREAKSTDRSAPTTVGYGVTSDPIRDCSFDSLFAAVELSIREPWRVIAVDQAACEVQDCQGYVQRRMKLSATGEMVVERVTVSEERGV